MLFIGRRYPRSIGLDGFMFAGLGMLTSIMVAGIDVMQTADALLV